MSTATAFKHYRAFPFCPEDISATVGNASYVGNLTLAEAMAFFWNFEAFTFTTTGTVSSGGSTANGNMVFTISPTACVASDRTTKSMLQDVCAWFGSSPTTMTANSNWPPVRQPRERVCDPGSGVTGTMLDIYSDDGATATCNVTVEFYVGLDPINAGKYRIFCFFTFNFLDPTTGTVEMKITNRSSVGGMTNYASGTFTILGHSFPWYAWKTIGATHSGGDLTASSTSFTY